MMELPEEKVSHVRKSIDFMHNVSVPYFIGGLGLGENWDYHGCGIDFWIVHSIGHSMCYIGAQMDAKGRQGTPVRYIS